MIQISRRSLRILVVVYFWIFQFSIAYIATLLWFGSSANPTSTLLASATTDLHQDTQSIYHRDLQNTSHNVLDNSRNILANRKCLGCRLASNSLVSIVKSPRLMDSYGRLDDKIDLDKISKRVCSDINEDDDREACKSFYFDNLPAVEKWKQSNSKTNFFDFICIKELKLCCPRNGFGPKCTKCNECGPNEICNGEGTRTGDGKCICTAGHAGPNCNLCQAGYYLDTSKRGSKKKGSTTCSPCHRSCLYCRQEGSLGCEVCRLGFTWLSQFGCSDINECVQNTTICGSNTFCVNTEGSYFCYECDKGCDGCHGDGPDMCLRCAKGFQLKDGNCLANKMTVLPPEANYYRYAIYTGLCICACIILHNNVYLASLVGLGVAMYIGVSEYVMSTNTGGNLVPNLKT